MPYTDASDPQDAPAKEQAEAQVKLPVSESELLGILGDERRRSVGFDHDAELSGEREKALYAYKGQLPDVKAPANRSSAVDTTVSDAIDTILPDIQEMLTGGDDVVAFLPQGPEDEAAAAQETDFVNHVVFNQNDGWMVLHTIIKDALLVKTGVVKYWWEDYDDEEETLEGKTLLDLPQISQDGEIVAITPSDDDPDLLDIRVRRKGGGKLCIKAVPPEDFTVAADTVSLRDATYCAVRSRPRAQELIVQGFDPEVIRKLPPYGAAGDQAVNDARDTANETETKQGGVGDLRYVEVVEHYIRLETNGKLQLWRVLTGGAETELIDYEPVDMIPLAAITPFVVTHRFYGESVADRLLEVMRIKTVLTRSHLDALYFALNQRYEVSMANANEFTLTDLLRNEPGMPVRSVNGEAVRPIAAGTLNFNTLDALEYYSTVAEQRSGVVRAAQGLTPDTLHETARGALALLTQAQKRVRMIARIFAETGIKDLFLGVHAMLRKHASQQATVRLRGQWVNVSPTSWGQREDMSIEIGLGASGREHDLMQIQQQIQVAQQVIELQGGANGPFITPPNVYNLLKRFFEKSGAKSPELYVTDPKDAPPQAPKPDPAILELQGKLEIEKAKVAAKTQADATAAEQNFQIRQQEVALNHQREMEQLREELAMEREKLAAQLATQREVELIKANNRHAADMTRINASVSSVEAGGDPG